MIQKGWRRKEVLTGPSLGQPQGHDLCQNQGQGLLFGIAEIGQLHDHQSATGVIPVYHLHALETFTATEVEVGVVITGAVVTIHGIRPFVVIGIVTGIIMVEVLIEAEAEAQCAAGLAHTLILQGVVEREVQLHHGIGEMSGEGLVEDLGVQGQGI